MSSCNDAKQMLLALPNIKNAPCYKDKLSLIQVFCYNQKWE